jgi:hypothetical protein
MAERRRGRVPLASLSDQLADSRVERGSGWWIDTPVGFVELGYPGLTVVDPPTVLM